MNIYDIKAKIIGGDEVSLSQYKDKVMLIVNVASKCGYTKQYSELEILYGLYKDKGFIVLGFPCNQFLLQEPGADEKIIEFCTMNYNVTFPIFSKIEVNGKKSHPLYKYLREDSPEEFRGDIRWNFTKFLVSKSGDIVDRYDSKITPMSIKDEIEKLIML